MSKVTHEASNKFPQVGIVQSDTNQERPSAEAKRIPRRPLLYIGDRKMFYQEELFKELTEEESNDLLRYIGSFKIKDAKTNFLRKLEDSLYCAVNRGISEEFYSIMDKVYSYLYDYQKEEEDGDGDGDGGDDGDGDDDGGYDEGDDTQEEDSVNELDALCAILDPQQVPKKANSTSVGEPIMFPNFNFVNLNKTRTRAKNGETIKLSTIMVRQRKEVESEKPKEVAITKPNEWFNHRTITLCFFKDGVPLGQCSNLDIFHELIERRFENHFDTKRPFRLNKDGMGFYIEFLPLNNGKSHSVDQNSLIDYLLSTPILRTEFILLTLHLESEYRGWVRNWKDTEISRRCDLLITEKRSSRSCLSRLKKIISNVDNAVVLARKAVKGTTKVPTIEIGNKELREIKQFLISLLKDLRIQYDRRKITKATLTTIVKILFQVSSLGYGIKGLRGAYKIRPEWHIMQQKLEFKNLTARQNAHNCSMIRSLKSFVELLHDWEKSRDFSMKVCCGYIHTNMPDVTTPPFKYIRIEDVAEIKEYCSWIQQQKQKKQPKKEQEKQPKKEQEKQQQSEAKHTCENSILHAINCKACMVSDESKLVCIHGEHCWRHKKGKCSFSHSDDKTFLGNILSCLCKSVFKKHCTREKCKFLHHAELAKLLPPHLFRELFDYGLKYRDHVAAIKYPKDDPKRKEHMQTKCLSVFFWDVQTTDGRKSIQEFLKK
jgi:hypothetical protein